MTDNEQVLEVLEACEKRRVERRAFLRSGSSAAMAAAGAGLLAGCFGGDDNNSQPQPGPPPPPPPPTGTPPPPPPPTGAITDADILNFALNLEYLEAQFYAIAANGAYLPDNLLGGTGTRGQVTGGKQVQFTDPVVAAYAREIANDERQHVVFLRATLGASAVAQPAIDISVTANSAFSAAARAAGLIGPNDAFDPYVSDENFLLGAYIFEDVGVTAYKGASPLITNKTFLEAAAGILAAEAYHAGLVRTVLYAKGVQMPALVDATEKISDARDSLDNPRDVDQGVRQRGQMSNIVPADANGLAYSRTPGDVLNIVYLTAAAAQQGGFFPAGVNGTLRSSSAD
ncbi:MAG TPA: ferritin-like domain-containing protein [Allosphingosinicella sp.]|nr:ferritin-like domain-containing protein [Allosphingosinicella sp.]